MVMLLLSWACAPAPMQPPPALGGSTQVVGTVGGPAPVTVPPPTGDTGAAGLTADTATTPLPTPTGTTGSTGTTGDTGLEGCVDPFDPNDDVAAAVPLPIDTPLRVDDAHPDWFTLTIPPGERHDLAVYPFEVELTVTSADGTPERYPRAWLALGNNSDADHVVHLEATSDDGTCLDYTVSATVVPEPPCGPDGVGDDPASATALQRYLVGSTTFWAEDTVGTADEDWYVLDLPAGSTPRIEVWGRDEGVMAELFADPSDPPIARHDGFYSYDYFTVYLPQPATGSPYYLRLASVGSYAGCPRMQVYVSP